MIFAFSRVPILFPLPIFIVVPGLIVKIELPEKIKLFVTKYSLSAVRVKSSE